MNPGPPTSLQLDALREVANIGVAHAANALSKLLGGRPVHIDVPRVQLCEADEVDALFSETDSSHVFANLGLTGGLTGQLSMVLPNADAHRLCNVLLGREAPLRGPMDEAARSVIAEVSNIVASACLNAIASLSGFSLLPTPPEVSEGHSDGVTSSLLEASRDLSAVVLEARFSTQVVPPFSGQLLIVPDAPSLALLLQRLGV